MEILTDPNVTMPNEPAMTFNFKCDPFQVHAFNAIENNHHILVTAPTASGKTVCAEYAIAYHINKKHRIIYTSPIKSLSNEKYKEFKENKPEISVGLLTGDNKINPDADVLIVTAEILRNALYQPDKIYVENSTKPILQDVKCVIMDEVHFINDYDRGKIWEETIILLNDDIKLVLLSATINRASEFAQWISSVKKSKVSLIPTNRRIVPLEHYFYVDNELHKILDNQDNFYEDKYFETRKIYDKIKKENKYKIDYQEIPRLIKFLREKDLLQSIFFSFSRRKCEEYANQIQTYLIDTEDQREVIRVFDYYMRPYIKIYEHMPQYLTIKKLLERGVCFHHSGLIPIFKEIIEIIFRLGLIKVLFATETFAVGVNMPTRTIVFTELSKTTNRGKRFLNTAEYKQMSGRAGRRGKDTKGTVIILPLYEYPELLDIKNVMVKTMPHIDSKFKIDYSYCLKTVNNINIDNKIDTYKLFDMSLRNKTHINTINQTLEEIKDLENKINNHEFNKHKELQKDLENDCKKLQKLTGKDKNNDLSLNFTIKLTPQMKKELSSLKSKVGSILDIYQDYEQAKTNLNNKIADIDYYNNFIVIQTDKIFKLLINNNFISLLDNYKLTAKGICASMINECNGILLTDIIFSGMLDNLNSKEIISLMSIFLTAPRTEQDYNYVSYNLNKEYKAIKTIVDNYLQQEKDLDINIEDEEYWTITNNYIDICYDWVNDKPIRIILEQLYEMEEYEGGFVRNMLKLYNILTNLKNVAEVINKIELVIKLEDVSKMIMKDIVNINSLYLS